MVASLAAIAGEPDFAKDKHGLLSGAQFEEGLLEFEEDANYHRVAPTYADYADHVAVGALQCARVVGRIAP